MELADMADSEGVDSKEEQDADALVDNSCYEQILSKFCQPNPKPKTVCALNVCKKCCINSNTYSLSTNRCGLPAGGAVFRERAS